MAKLWYLYKISIVKELQVLNYKRENFIKNNIFNIIFTVVGWIIGRIIIYW